MPSEREMSGRLNLDKQHGTWRLQSILNARLSFELLVVLCKRHELRVQAARSRQPRQHDAQQDDAEERRGRREAAEALESATRKRQARKNTCGARRARALQQARTRIMNCWMSAPPDLPSGLHTTSMAALPLTLVSSSSGMYATAREATARQRARQQPACWCAQGHALSLHGSNTAGKRDTSGGDGRQMQRTHKQQLHGLTHASTWTPWRRCSAPRRRTRPPAAA